jgi:threonine synthase
MKSPKVDFPTANQEQNLHYAAACEVCKQSPTLPYRANCSHCGGSIAFTYTDALPFYPAQPSPALGLWQYRRHLPIAPHISPVTLQEGLTPLIRARDSRPFDLYLKNETVNPTGSHKDRAQTVAVTKAVELGFDTCMLYSDGSAALSSAAYAARAGLRNIAVVPSGADASRLYPLMAYGSDLLEFTGDAAAALDWVHEACQTLGLYETSTYRQANPFGAEGPKTISYEIYQQLGSFPDWVVVAVGGGGTLAAIWKGFLELKAAGFTGTLPKLVGVLPDGYRVLELGAKHAVRTDSELRKLADFPIPDTAQVKIAMRYPPDGIDAIASIGESAGRFEYATDEAAWAAQVQLGAANGIYAEISATVPLVAVDTLYAEGTIAEGDSVVAVICGSGFRETAAVRSPIPVRRVQIDQATGMKRLETLLKQPRH